MLCYVYVWLLCFGCCTVMLLRIDWLVVIVLPVGCVLMLGGWVWIGFWRLPVDCLLLGLLNLLFGCYVLHALLFGFS